MRATSRGRNFFGGLLAFMLLILYSSILIYMMMQVVDCGEAASAACKAIDENQGMIYVVTTIGGLISALVITELAITPAGENIAHRFMEPADASAPPPATSEKIVRGAITTLTYSYLISWVMLGVGALVIGVVLYPEVSITVRAMGNTWLGLAVAAGYSYFGIKS